MIEIFRVNFRHRESVLAEVSGELQERSILLAHIVQDTDRGDFVAGQPDDLTAGASEFTLQRTHLRDRRVETLFEEMLENVHEVESSASCGASSTKITPGCRAEWRGHPRAKHFLDRCGESTKHP